MPDLAQANLAALIESTEDIIWSVDLDYRLVTFNRALQQAFEVSYGVQAALGMRGEDLLPPERAAIFPPLYERALREGHFRVEYVLLDGRTLELAFNPIVIDGKPTGVSVFGKDISERKAAEKALLEAEEKYREIFAGALEGIFQTTLEGRALSANPALARMLGYDSPEDFTSTVKDTAHDVWVDPNERSRYVRLLEEKGVLRGFECRLKRKDGATIWVSLNSRKTCGADGRTILNEGFIEDITERRRAAEALAESEARFRTLFEENGSVMLLLEPSSGVITDANRTASAFYGYSRE